MLFITKLVHRGSIEALISASPIHSAIVYLQICHYLDIPVPLQAFMGLRDTKHYLLFLVPFLLPACAHSTQHEMLLIIVRMDIRCRILDPSATWIHDNPGLPQNLMVLACISCPMTFLSFLKDTFYITNK